MVTKTIPYAFSHPDYTVGIGVTPIHAVNGSRTIPPVGNHTLPQRPKLFNYILDDTISQTKMQTLYF